MELANSFTDDLEAKHQVDGSCWKAVTVTSDGVFNQKAEDNIFRHPLIVLQLQLATTFIVATLIHLLLRRYNLPRLISEVLAGVILGPTVLGRFFPTMSDILFPRNSLKILNTLRRFGYLFFMFLIGVKMDVNLITKSGKREWTIGSFVIVFPLLIIVRGAKIISTTVDKMDKNSLEWVTLFSGVLMLTSFPVVACLLMHLKIINSELGHLALSSALISDLISVVIVNSSKYGELRNLASFRVAMKSMSLSIALVMFVIIILRPAMYWIIRRTPEGKSVKDAYIFFLVIALMLVAVVGDNVGLRYLYGPFILGLTVPTGPPLASTLIDKLDTIVTGWMLPLTSTYCGYKSNLWELNRWPPVFVIFVITVGFLLKTTCGFISAICFKMPYKDAIALALMLTAKGIIELGTFATNANEQMLEDREFTLVMLSVVIVTAIITPIIKILYDPSKLLLSVKRSTIHLSKRDLELQFLVCLHKAENLPTIMNILEVSHASEESPVAVTSMVLVELVGRSSPLLVPSQRRRGMFRTNSSTVDQVFNALSRYEKRNVGCVTIQSYTSISHIQTMHNDICRMALEKRANLVIVPFHKQRTIDGQIESSSRPIQNLNINVLEKAPCSVGILVDRGSLTGYVSVLTCPLQYRVAVIFIGGPDDMESLDYGCRMMKQKVLRDVVGLSSYISGMLEDYHLILVGRQQRDSPLLEGLGDWIECPDLGAVGDMLASPDCKTTATVLVIQQHRLGGKLLNHNLSFGLRMKRNSVCPDLFPSSTSHLSYRNNRFSISSVDEYDDMYY
ncbi:hypothetical protein PTKIN_Ptkin01aG0145500 [Pterospermum kingtungense]